VLILVRHGQTAANADGLVLGRLDPPLTVHGREQAAAVAAVLPRPTRLISSPLVRAQETAAAFGVPVEVDERWIEFDYGDMDGVPVAEVPDELWDQWRADHHFSPGGGESLAAVGQRVRDAVGDVLADASDGDVVVVTHVSPIKAAIAWALEVPDAVAWRLFVDQASISRIAMREFGPVLLSFNEHYVRPEEPPR
jgi:broad specificity phosphatase PhoE